MDYSPGSKGKFGKINGKKKGAKSPKPKRPCSPNLAHMHILSTSTCMNFLSQFYFLTTWTVVHGPKGKFEGKRKASKSLKPKKPHPPNLVHMYTL